MGSLTVLDMFWLNFLSFTTLSCMIQHLFDVGVSKAFTSLSAPFIKTYVLINDRFFASVYSFLTLWTFEDTLFFFQTLSVYFQTNELLELFLNQDFWRFVEDLVLLSLMTGSTRSLDVFLSFLQSLCKLFSNSLVLSEHC